MEVDDRIRTIKVFILIANACSIVAVNAPLSSSRGMVCDLREATFLEGSSISDADLTTVLRGNLMLLSSGSWE
jgi:hypothetical protein